MAEQKDARPITGITHEVWWCKWDGTKQIGAENKGELTVPVKEGDSEAYAIKRLGAPPKGWNINLTFVRFEYD